MNFGKLRDGLSVQSILRDFPIPDHQRPSNCAVAQKDAFKGYFVAKLAHRAHHWANYDEYAGPSLIAKNQNDAKSMAQLYDLLHGQRKFSGSLKFRRRWWDRTYIRFCEMRRARMEPAPEQGDVEHSACEFIRMQRMLYQANPAVMSDVVREKMESKFPPAASSNKKRKM